MWIILWLSIFLCVLWPIIRRVDMINGGKIIASLFGCSASCSVAILNIRIFLRHSIARYLSLRCRVDYLCLAFHFHLRWSQHEKLSNSEFTSRTHLRAVGRTLIMFTDQRNDVDNLCWQSTQCKRDETQKNVNNWIFSGVILNRKEPRTWKSINWEFQIKHAVEWVESLTMFFCGDGVE